MNPSHSLFEMEMERLDAEIDKTRKQFHTAVLGKKRAVKRTWLEISALTNAHILQMLPYKAMLGHVAKLAEERDRTIEEIMAFKEKEDDIDLNEDILVIDNSYQETPTSSSSRSRESSMNESESSERVNARDEAVQTEESSFQQD